MRFADLVAVLDSVAGSDVRKHHRAELTSFLAGQSAADLGTLTTLLLRMPLDGIEEATRTDVPPRSQPTLTCEQVSHSIAEIDRAAPEALYRGLVQRLLASATEPEQRWIDVALHRPTADRATFELVSSVVAKAAGVPVRDVRRAATLSGSLPLSARIAFERGTPGLHAVTFTPGRPIPPTVVEITDSPSLLVDPPWPAVLEWQPHADVVQVHRVRGEVTVYDRLLRDVTAAVPAIVEQVTDFPRGDLVLEGWADLGGGHSSESRVAARWTRMGRAGLAGGRALFFDVLFDGAPDVDEPLSVRREVLESIVPEPSRLPALEFGDLDAVAAALNECARSGHVGLVLKPAGDAYEGGLTKSSWRLVPSTRAVKLAVVGAERGAGERSDFVTKVHLAAPDELGRLHEVAATARGLSKEQAAWQTELLAEYFVDADDEVDGRRPLRPGVVAVVATDGIDESDRYDVGITLRRPRVLGYELETESHSETEIGVATVESLRKLSDADATPAPGLPRLPDAPAAAAPWPVRPLEAVAPQTSPPEVIATVAPGRPPEGRRAGSRSIADVKFAPYHEPELSESDRPGRAVIAIRILALCWVVAVLITGLIERSRSGAIDGSTVATIGWLGVPISAMIVATGWAWSDRLVRNLIRLDGRRPSRARCVRAWLSPPVAAVALALVVVPLEPSRPADIRPAVIVAVFALAMWRPYALIRRIITTLTPLRSDTLIVSAFLVDALCVGVMWWRLSEWRFAGDELTSGEVDVFVGATGAAAVAMVISLVMWIALVRAAARAEAQRRSSQRTRYEHRMLRLAGVNPSDPEVWWTLVQRRAEEQRAAEEPDTAAEPGAAAAGRVDGLPSVDSLIEATRAEHSLAFRRLGAEASERLEQRLREEFSAIVDRSFEDPDDPAGPRLPPVLAPLGSGPGAPSGGDDRPGDDVDDPIVALRRHAVRTEQAAPTLRDLETLIGRAGSLEVEAALAEQRKEAAGREELVPPTLYGLEAARLAMVAAFGALAVLNGWIVSIALRSDFDASTGGLPASAVDDLDIARDLFWAMFTSGAALVPIWAMVVLTHARRLGIEGLRLRRVVLLAVLAAAACAVGFALETDGRSELSLVLSVVIVWAAVSAGLCVEPVRAWFELPSWTLTTWIGTLPPIVLVAWLAGLATPLDAGASLQRLAFTTILLAFGCARVAAVSLLSSVDVEDKFRTAPELAVRPRRRR